MTAKYVSVVGTFGYTPAEGAQDARFSIAFSLPFTQKAEDELIFNAPVASRAVDLGTMTTPKAVLILCTEGACTLKLASGDTGTAPLGLSASPQSGEQSYFLWVNPLGGTITPYLTIAATAKVKVLVFG
jgi:hypothetical protein